MAVSSLQSRLFFCTLYGKGLEGGGGSGRGKREVEVEEDLLEWNGASSARPIIGLGMLDRFIIKGRFVYSSRLHRVMDVTWSLSYIANYVMRPSGGENKFGLLKALVSPFPCKRRTRQGIYMAFVLVVTFYQFKKKVVISVEQLSICL